MSKKDYERAATVVQDMRATGYTDVEIQAAKTAFAVLFRSDGNPRFDEARFRRACTPGANVRARG